MWWGGPRTDIDRQTADRREEHLNIGPSDQFRIHPSRLFKEGSSKKGLGARIGLNQLFCKAHIGHLHPEALSDARKIPNRLHSRLADGQLNTRIQIGNGAVLIQ